MTHIIGPYTVGNAWPEVSMDIAFPDLGTYPLWLRTRFGLDELTDTSSLTAAERLARNVTAINRVYAALNAASDIGDVLISFEARASAAWTPAP